MNQSTIFLRPYLIGVVTEGLIPPHEHGSCRYRRLFISLAIQSQWGEARTTWLRICMKPLAILVYVLREVGLRNGGRACEEIPH